MKALYDMAREVASYDFFSWLVVAAAKGAKEIIFNTEYFKQKRWPDNVLRKRFKTIIEPGPALLGIPHRFGKEGVRPHGPHLRDLVGYYNSGKRFPRLKSVMQPRTDVRYTVTLRNNPHVPHHNSNDAAWREFAAEVGAHVIEDYDTKHIHLHKRMALYAGAEMNFGVVNGPMHLIALSEYPMMTFGWQGAAETSKKCGIAKGAGYPWLRPNQQMIWEPDDLPVIRRHFAAWKARQ